ncbi:hypothetical protein ACFQ51_39770 [Streptomyces kaempferi]
MDGHRTAAGVPLSALLAHGPVDHVRTARIGLDLLDVLGAAHQEGFTHGDLSPGHVWVEEFGGLTVGGFGLMGATDSPRVTAPSYASPEQARGEGGGPATDLWALGAIMYEMVEGRRRSGTGAASRRRSAQWSGCPSGSRSTPGRSVRPSRGSCAGIPWSGCPSRSYGRHSRASSRRSSTTRSRPGRCRCSRSPASTARARDGCAADGPSAYRCCWGERWP